MKKFIVILCVSMMLVTSAYAGSKENCGCGLGQMALGDQDSLLMQLVVTFLNGICGNQTFGISSGTLGCQKPSTIVLNEQLNIFVADNMDNLAVDIAAGQGETLDALAEIAQIPVEKRGEFNLTLQNNFDSIYLSQDVTNKDVVSKIQSIVESI
ncbi:MAG: DUF3015 family protein [Desulfobacterales bacterium]|nr:DUF3015 family protein [Desulfobacterales bacterium]